MGIPSSVSVNDESVEPELSVDKDVNLELELVDEVIALVVPVVFRLSFLVNLVVASVLEEVEAGVVVDVSRQHSRKAGSQGLPNEKSFSAHSCPKDPVRMPMIFK